MEELLIITVPLTLLLVILYYREISRSLYIIRDNQSSIILALEKIGEVVIELQKQEINRLKKENKWIK